ncbi:MAG TPA: RNA-binding protein, partial [Myxococcales bacterium]|nr:RNA-binding protein [Myxococcales bacterium]
MSKKLFVGGLRWGTTEDTLLDAFSQFGDVEEAKIITDRETGRSRGFGFVTFANDADAEEAIQSLDGTDLD